MIGLGQDVEFLAAVCTMGVAHHVDLLEHVEGAIDGRRSRLRIRGAAPVEQFGGGDMALGLGEDAHQQAPLRGPAQAALSQSIARG